MTALVAIVKLEVETGFSAVFLNEKLDLRLFCLLAILDSAFPSLLAYLQY